MNYLKVADRFINVDHISALCIGEDALGKDKVYCEISFNGLVISKTFDDLISNDETNQNLCYVVLGLIDSLKSKTNTRELAVIDIEDIIYDVYNDPTELSEVVSKSVIKKVRKDA